MTSQPYALNRTAEWGRLTRAGFFKVDDQPGEITLSKGPMPVFACLGMAVIFGLGPLLFSPYLFPLGIIFGAIWLWGAWRNMRHGYRVRFTSDELTFYGPFGQQLGSLPREAMQQIVVKQEETKNKKGERIGGYYHMFIADMGWMSAFFAKEETKAAVQNNVLMAAFAQPVHLDLLQTEAAFTDQARPVNLAIPTAR